MGLVALAAGILLAVVVAMHPEHLNAPAWVAYLAATTFVFAGASALARGYQRFALADGLVCCVLGVILLVEIWIGFGPGTRRCTAGVSGLAVSISGNSCRAAFGVGAFVVAAMLAFAVRGWRKRRSAD